MLSNKGRHNTTRLGPNAVQELKINQRRILIDSLEIGIPAPKQMIALGERQLPNGIKVGQLLNSKTLNYKKFTPHRDGLFCERIFGPVQSFVCACGKKKESVQGKNRQKEAINTNVLTSTSILDGVEGITRPQKQVLFCPKCQVEYISKDVRRHRLGYIKLFAPVTHIWYLKGRPSYLSLFLGKRKKAMTSLAYCNAFLVEQVYSDFKSETQNVLKNVENSTTDLLEKSEKKREKKSKALHVNNVKKKQVLNKFGKSLIAPDWYQTHKAVRNQINFSSYDKNSFFSLLVNLFPKTSIQFTNFSSTPIKEETFEKDEQKRGQRNKEEERVQKRSFCKSFVCTSNTAKASISNINSSLLNLNKASIRQSFAIEANITKHNKEKIDFFQNKARLTGTSYIRAQTLPFLPSLISPFHLRDCLISFLQSTPCPEDVPIPLYCQTPRRYPLRDVHKFITEFRSEEVIKKAERLTSESIIRLTGISKQGKPFITSYLKKHQTKQNLITVFSKKKAKEKEIEGASIKAKLWFTKALEARSKTSWGRLWFTELLSARTKTKFWLTKFVQNKQNKSKASVLAKTNLKVSFDACTQNKQALYINKTKSFYVKLKQKQTGRYKSYANKSFCFFDARTNKVCATGFEYTYQNFVLVCKALLCSHRVLNNNLQLWIVVPSGLVNTFTRLKVTTFALPGVNNFFYKNSTRYEQNKSALFSVTNKQKANSILFYSSTKAEKQAVKALPFLFNYQYKGEPDSANKALLYSHCSSFVVAKKSAQDKAFLRSTVFCSKQKALLGYQRNRKFTYLYFPTLLYVSKTRFNTKQTSFFKTRWYTSQARTMRVKQSFLETQTKFVLHKQSKPKRSFGTCIQNKQVYAKDLISVQTKNSKKTWSGCFGESGINYQSQPQNLYKNLFSNNLLSYSIKKETQTYQARLLYMVFGAVNQNSNVDQLTQPVSDSLFKWSKKQPSLNNRYYTSLHPTAFAFVTQRTKRSFICSGSALLQVPLHLNQSGSTNLEKSLTPSKQSNVCSVQAFAKHKDTSSFLETTPQKAATLSCRPLSCFLQAIKSGDILTMSLSIRLPSFVLGSKQNRVFFITKKERKVEWRVGKTHFALFDSLIAQAQTQPNFVVLVNEQHKVLSKAELCFTREHPDSAWKRTSGDTFLQLPFEKKGFFFSNNLPDPTSKKTDQYFLTCSSIKACSFKKPTDFISSSFPDLNVFSCILVKNFKTSEQRLFNHHALKKSIRLYNTCVNQVQEKQSDNVSEQRASVTGTHNFIESSSDQPFTKMWLEQRHANLLATRPYKIFLRGPVLNKASLCLSSKTLKAKSDQIKAFTDTNQALSKNSQTSFGSEMISKWHLNGAREILLYTGGGALESLLKRFDISLFYEFLSSEIQILRKNYKNQMFFIANYNKNKVLEKQDYAKTEQTKQSFVTYDSFALNNVNQSKTENTSLDLNQRFSGQKALNLTKQQVSSRLGLKNSFTNFQSGNKSVPEVCATKPMQTVKQTSFFNVYERRFHFVKAAIKKVDATTNVDYATGFVQASPLNAQTLLTKTSFWYVHSKQVKQTKTSFLQPLGLFASQKRSFCVAGVRFGACTLQASLNKTLLTTEKNTNSFCRRIYRTTRRLKIVQLLLRSQRRPEWMMISILPVLPPDLRPVLQMGENLIVASDLNTLYQRVIYRNNRHYKGRFLDFHFVSSIHRLVQDAVDRLIENGKGGSTPFLTPGGRPLKSLSDILKGKRGRFRFNLLGKRVDFSGRSVIVVSPNLKIHECGLPREMALELYKYLLIRQLILKKRVSSIVNAKKVIKQRKPFIWDMLREIIYYHPLLLNRAPTLHRLGIQAFQPKLTLGNAILLHPLVCAGFNADFDGDQMGVHLPLSPQARAEAWDLLWSRNNLLSPATGQPILLPSQDMVLGFYYMTALLPFGTRFTLRDENPKASGEKIATKQSLIKPSGFLSKNHSIASNENKIFTHVFSDTSQIVHAYQKKQIDIHTPIWLKWAGKAENGEKQQIPLELRLDTFACKTQIYPTYKYKSQIYKQKTTSFLTFKKNNTVTIHIRTTVGRVLVNNLISRD